MATPTNLPASFVTGNVLTAAQMNNLRGAFRILQVVTATYATAVTSTSATYVDSGLTANITPQSTSSLILAFYSENVYSSAATTGCGIRLVRDVTVLETKIDYCYGTASGLLANHGMWYLDSPATTSALTYKTQFNRTTGAGTVFVQPNNNPSSLILMEISA